MAAWPAHAAIAVAQVEQCSATAATTCTTGNLTTTNGNLFVVSTSYCCDTFTSITDSKSNAYTNSIADVTDNSGGKVRQDYKAGGTGGATHNWTLTGGSSSFFGTISVMEVSGAAASPLDQIASFADIGGGTSHSTGNTPTTSQADELLIGFGGTISTTTYTTDAGWTERLNVATDGSHEGIITGSQVVSATGAYAYTFTTGSSVFTAQGISTWKAAAAATTRQRCIGCGIDKKVIGQ